MKMLDEVDVCDELTLHEEVTWPLYQICFLFFFSFFFLFCMDLVN